MTDIVIPASIINNTITVTQPVNEPNGIYVVSWSYVPGVSTYKVYISPTPLTPNLFATVTGANTYSFTPAQWAPQDTVYYFWISYIGYGNTETFINSFPAYLGQIDAFSATDASTRFSQETIDNSLIYCGDPAMTQYYFEEIRRRHAAILQNDGEYFYLYIRKYTGRPCDCTKSSSFIVDDSDAGLVNNKADIDSSSAGDPDYQGLGRCPNCFGTGLYGGYYPKIKIFARYGDMPKRTNDFSPNGFTVRHDFNSWTLWHPKLHTHDFMHRISTGDRFLVDEVGQSEMRGVPFRQEMKLINKPHTDILYAVNDVTIAAGMSQGAIDDAADPNPYYKLWQ